MSLRRVRTPLLIIMVVAVLLTLLYFDNGMTTSNRSNDIDDMGQIEFASGMSEVNMGSRERAKSRHRVSHHKRVKKKGIWQLNQNLHGAVVDYRGIRQQISSNVTTELVFSFSPETEMRFSEKLVDPNHEQRVYANSPAMIWDGHKFIVVMRMWLDKEDTLKSVSNIFSDNYFYWREYNDKMEALDNGGRIQGMATRAHIAIGNGSAWSFFNCCSSLKTSHLITWVRLNSRKRLL